MTIVKVQRPLYSKDSQESKLQGPWLVYDQLNARECVLTEVPEHVRKALDEPQGRATNMKTYRRYFDGAVWVPNADGEHLWDLSKAVVLPHKRSRSW